MGCSFSYNYAPLPSRESVSRQVRIPTAPVDIALDKWFTDAIKDYGGRLSKSPDFIIKHYTRRRSHFKSPEHGLRWLQKNYVKPFPCGSAIYVAQPCQATPY